jgi:hypothetical protein
MCLKENSAGLRAESAEQKIKDKRIKIEDCNEEDFINEIPSREELGVGCLNNKYLINNNI